MVIKQFYAELGKLFYAIAAIDNWITEKEKNKILEIVKNELVPNELNTDEYGTDLAYFTQIEFEFLNEEDSDPLSAIDSFIDFIEEHHSALDQHSIRTCIRLSKEISKIYRGTNKKEYELIEKLKAALSQRFHDKEKQI
jgi:hypothetical protein